MTNQTNNTNQTKNNKKQTLIIVLLVLIIVICVTVLIVLLLQPKEEPTQDSAKGVVGTITDNWDHQVSTASEGSPSPQEGTLIPGYGQAEMKAGDTTLKLRVGNPKENTVGFLATVKLNDGTVLYTSPLLKPGQGLEEIPLNQTLAKGTYPAMVFYQCVLLDEEQTPINAAESTFTLIVN